MTRFIALYTDDFLANLTGAYCERKLLSMERVVVFGSDGYVGAVLSMQLQESQIQFVGLDSKWFSPSPDDREGIATDVRDFDLQELGFTPSAIVYLSAVSNDPIGESFSVPTLEINAHAAERIAVQAKSLGVSRFIVASSCSVYGDSGKDARSETDRTMPLTTYAKSKVLLEDSLRPLADSSFRVIALRFATACGPSPSQRLDVVLNDLVASALSSGVIGLNSDGQSWRPLIDVRDMARAIIWALTCAPSGMSPFEVINVGSEQSTLRVIDLANEVASAFPGVEIHVRNQATVDARSYTVDFAKFRNLAPAHQPRISVQQSISDLREYLDSESFFAPAPRRLEHLLGLIHARELDENLRWL